MDLNLYLTYTGKV